MEHLYEVLVSLFMEDPARSLREYIIASMMFDTENKCGIIMTTEGYSALHLRDLLIKGLKVYPRLSFNVKEDFLHPVLGAMAPRTFAALPVGALTMGLKMMNSTFTKGLFAPIKRVPKGKEILHYYVLSYDMVRRIQKKGYVFQNFYGTVKFLPEITYIKANRMELEDMFLDKQEASPSKSSPSSSPKRESAPLTNTPLREDVQDKHPPVQMPRMEETDPAAESEGEDEVSGDNREEESEDQQGEDENSDVPAE